MKYNNWILGVLFLVGFTAFSQEKYIKHTVAKGETISKIAQQYQIKANAIYDLNPDARNGIKFKSTLLIPNSTKEITKATASVSAKNSKKIHAVLPKETIYGIAKQYGLSVADLYKENPTLEKTGLRKGGKITIPVTETNAVLVAQSKASVDKVQKESTVVVPQENSRATIVREVLASETKYAIAREYGISVAEIEAANPVLLNEPLKIGQQLVIPSKIESSTTVSTLAQSNTPEPAAVAKPILIDRDFCS